MCTAASAARRRPTESQRPSCRPARLPLPCPAAIRFVLDDLNSTLSQEERRRLLHVSLDAGGAALGGMGLGAGVALCAPRTAPLTGCTAGPQAIPLHCAFCVRPQESVGHHVLSAYVEIVFDNSDGRLPVDKTEVGAGAAGALHASRG